MCDRKMAATFQNAITDERTKSVALYRARKAHRNEQRDDTTITVINTIMALRRYTEWRKCHGTRLFYSDQYIFLGKVHICFCSN